MTEKRKPLTPPEIQAAIAAFAKERGLSLAALGRKLRLKSNHLMYVGKREKVSPALVGRFYCCFGNSPITKILAEACKQE